MGMIQPQTNKVQNSSTINMDTILDASSNYIRLGFEKLTLLANGEYRIFQSALPEIVKELTQVEGQQKSPVELGDPIAVNGAYAHTLVHALNKQGIAAYLDDGRRETINYKGSKRTIPHIITADSTLLKYV